MMGAGPQGRSFALRRSASLRLMLSIGAVIVIAALAAMAVQYHWAANALERQSQAALRADLDGFAALYEQRRIVALRQAIELRTQTTKPDQALYLLQDRKGVVLAGNMSAWPAGITRKPTALAQGQGQSANLSLAGGAQPYLVAARELPGGFPFLVAHTRTPMLQTLARMRQTIWIVTGVMAGFALLAGWAVARRTVGRIGRINTLADQVAQGDLSARLTGERSADEFGDLERHVHAMLDRIENLNQATARLSDAIAHELRTPLNRIQQRLSKLASETGADQRVLDEIQNEMQSTIRIFDSLLDISSAEAAKGQRPGLEPVDFSKTAQEVFDLYAPLAEDKGLVYLAEITPDLWVLGDRSLLAQMISNLLDNAIKFIAPGDQITISLRPEGNQHVLRVADTGPGLPADIHGNEFARFVRSERDRDTAGHGLGLALVQAIAARHGAKVDTPPSDKGFVIVGRWPKLVEPN